jgi:hypothetical protein
VGGAVVLQVLERFKVLLDREDHEDRLTRIIAAMKDC